MRLPCRVAGPALLLASLPSLLLAQLSGGARVVATIGDRAVTEEELDLLAAGRLARLKSEEYNIRKLVLDEYIARTLMEKEAKARGITFAELEKAEIEAKVLAVTDDQKRAVFETNAQQFEGRSEAAAFAQIEANLRRVRLQEAKARLLATLRLKTPVKVVLAPPRTNLDMGQAPAMGPVDAAVTLVTFSDFQCPACARVYPTVKRLMDQYRGKIRLVFRDFPLPIHPDAPKAAEAGACADEQGKFWEMHDEMFQNQQRLGVPALKAAAASLGLDAAKFGTCLDSGKHASDWKADVDAGRKYGVSATPTFFINGRMMSGAAPYPAFAQIIDEELQREATPVAPKGEELAAAAGPATRRNPVCARGAKDAACVAPR